MADYTTEETEEGPCRPDCCSARPVDQTAFCNWNWGPLFSTDCSENRATGTPDLVTMRAHSQVARRLSTWPILLLEQLQLLVTSISLVIAPVIDVQTIG